MMRQSPSFIGKPIGSAETAKVSTAIVAIERGGYATAKGLASQLNTASPWQTQIDDDPDDPIHHVVMNPPDGMYPHGSVLTVWETGPGSGKFQWYCIPVEDWAIAEGIEDSLESAKLSAEKALCHWYRTLTIFMNAWPNIGAAAKE